jgi:hypothetical protein
LLEIGAWKNRAIHDGVALENGCTMIATFRTTVWRLLAGGLLVTLVAAGAGCQTFTLSEEDYQRQQREAVANADTLAWNRAMLGLDEALRMNRMPKFPRLKDR